jgi:hypothetical protein
MSAINLSCYASGSLLKVLCRDEKERVVIIKFGTGDGDNYPHLIKEFNSVNRQSLTDKGAVYMRSDPHPWDVVQVLPAQEARPEPSTLFELQGFNRSDLMPSAVHGSDRQGQILWRDSSDNDLELCEVGSTPSPYFDQWFPLAQVSFRVQKISESLKAHKEACEAWQADHATEIKSSFVKGYLKAKGVEFNTQDFEVALAS